MFRPQTHNSYHWRRRATERVVFGVGALASLGALYFTANPVVSVFENLPAIAQMGKAAEPTHEQLSLEDAKHDAELLAIAGAAISSGVLLRRKRIDLEFWGLVDDLELDFQAKECGDQLHQETVQYLRDNALPPTES